jgi:hypothetical protein
MEFWDWGQAMLRSYTLVTWDAGDVRTQEEMLKKCQCLVEKADYSALKTHILPRAQRMCLATTSAAVRQASFQALTVLAPRFDKEVATSLVNTLQQVFCHLLTAFSAVYLDHFIATAASVPE